MTNETTHVFMNIAPGELSVGDIIEGKYHRYLVLGLNKTAKHKQVSVYICREDLEDPPAFWVHHYVNSRVYAYVKLQS